MWHDLLGQSPIGMGCMRLSTAPERDDDRAVDVLHAAFDAGVTFLDTADAYGLDELDIGHNERLIARALASWRGERSGIVVATKGGLTRPGGRWVADGRARHLIAACEASRRALGVDRLSLYQLHAPDPRTPLATSVRALADLKHDGAIDQIGLCNVRVGQIEEASRIVEIATVQVELSVWNDDAILDGVARFCIDHQIALLAYRPLGGPRRLRRTLTDPALVQLAAHHRSTPAEIALAWLRDLSPAIVPLPGATRIETVHSIARSSSIVLRDEDRGALDERFPAGRGLRSQTRSRPRQQRNGEVVLIMGLPAAGKSTVAARFVAQGYERLNRDRAGGSLADLLPALDQSLTGDSPHVVLDNTYVSRKSRAQVIAVARDRELSVRCVWLQTSVEDAQINAVSRMLSTYGRLLSPDEIKTTTKHDVNAFGPAVQFRYVRELEPPTADEGFSTIEAVPFERRRRDASFTNRALIVWCDGTVIRSRTGLRVPASADDLEARPEDGERLRRYVSKGWHVLGLSWQPGVEEGAMPAGAVHAVFDRVREQLGVAIDIAYCPHAAGPPLCWCRKPLPGLAVAFIERYRLDPQLCVYVGSGGQDSGFARRLGFQFRDAEDFFRKA